jgi:hypothetical protein
MYIQGPVHVSVYSAPHQRTFILLGDHHVQQVTCPPKARNIKDVITFIRSLKPNNLILEQKYFIPSMKHYAREKAPRFHSFIHDVAKAFHRSRSTRVYPIDVRQALRRYTQDILRGKTKIQCSFRVKWITLWSTYFILNPVEKCLILHELFHHPKAASFMTIEGLKACIASFRRFMKYPQNTSFDRDIASHADDQLNALVNPEHVAQTVACMVDWDLGRLQADLEESHAHFQALYRTIQTPEQAHEMMVERFKPQTQPFFHYANSLLESVPNSVFTDLSFAVANCLTDIHALSRMMMSRDKTTTVVYMGQAHIRTFEKKCMQWGWQCIYRSSSNVLNADFQCVQYALHSNTHKFETSA